MKNLLYFFAIIAISVLSINKFNNNTHKMNALQLENVELLAQGEDLHRFRVVTYVSSSDKVICQDPGEKICGRYYH